MNIGHRKLEYDPEVDGITNSLLQNWGGCRERARLTLRGVTRRASGFALTYGGVTHFLLQHVYEDHRLGRLPLVNNGLSPKYVKQYLARVDQLWKEENPTVADETLKHYELTMMFNEHLMPLYFQHWRKRDFEETKWVGVESEFKIPFSVTRGATTYRTFLRGKRDGLFVPKGSTKEWLFETKTKTYIDEGLIAEILSYESQVNFYNVARWVETGSMPEGVRYNLIRRPSLRQKKKESLPQFAKRLVDDIKERPNWYFIRQNMRINPRELDRYLGELEDRIWEFMHWWRGYGGHWKESGQCENKYGVCPNVSICSKNDYTGFFIRERIFSELNEEL